MFCPVCGAPNLANAERCVSCQRPIAKNNSVAESVSPAANESMPNGGNNINSGGQPTGNYNYNYSQPFTGQPGVSAYANNPATYAAPVDQAGVSGYGLPPMYGSYSGPADRVGVSNYNALPNYGSYSLPIDRAGVAVRRNNFWPRVGAYLIDQIICSMIVFVTFVIPMIFWVSGFITQHANELSQVCSSNGTYDRSACTTLLNKIMFDQGGLGSVLSVGLSTGLLAIILVLAYEVLLTARGQTIGKKVFGLRVVKADGSAPGFWTALLRQTIGYMVSNAIFDLGFLWVAFDSRNRAWHDFMAGTYVVPA